MTSRSDAQLRWEDATGWAEDEKAATRHPVRWITGTRERRDDSWPTLSAWDHAFPVQHRDTGERAYLLMPYGLSPQSAVPLTEWCMENGVEWEPLDVDGWWADGTVAILVRCRHE